MEYLKDSLFVQLTESCVDNWCNLVETNPISSSAQSENESKTTTTSINKSLPTNESDDDSDNGDSKKLFGLTTKSIGSIFNKSLNKLAELRSNLIDNNNTNTKNRDGGTNSENVDINNSRLGKIITGLRMNEDMTQFAQDMSNYQYKEMYCELCFILLNFDFTHVLIPDCLSFYCREYLNDVMNEKIEPLFYSAQFQGNLKFVDSSNSLKSMSGVSKVNPQSNALLNSPNNKNNSKNNSNGNSNSKNSSNSNTNEPNSSSSSPNKLLSVSPNTKKKGKQFTYVNVGTCIMNYYDLLFKRKKEIELAKQTKIEQFKASRNRKVSQRKTVESMTVRAVADYVSKYDDCGLLSNVFTNCQIDGKMLLSFDYPGLLYYTKLTERQLPKQSFDHMAFDLRLPIIEPGRQEQVLIQYHNLINRQTDVLMKIDALGQQIQV